MSILKLIFPLGLIFPSGAGPRGVLNRTGLPTGVPNKSTVTRPNTVSVISVHDCESEGDLHVYNRDYELLAPHEIQLSVFGGGTTNQFTLITAGVNDYIGIRCENITDREIICAMDR